MEQYTREVLEGYRSNLETRINNALSQRRDAQRFVDQHSAEIHEAEARLRQINHDLENN